MVIFHSYVNVYQRVSIPLVSLGGIVLAPLNSWFRSSPTPRFHSLSTFTQLRQIKLHPTVQSSISQWWRCQKDSKGIKLHLNLNGIMMVLQTLPSFLRVVFTEVSQARPPCLRWTFFCWCDLGFYSVPEYPNKLVMFMGNICFPRCLTSGNKGYQRGMGPTKSHVGQPSHWLVHKDGWSALWSRWCNLWSDPFCGIW